jgi:hypothetical protein
VSALGCANLAHGVAACGPGDKLELTTDGMPELHKLTPALGVLQDRGHQVALVTDGRMSGASGKVPAAIHLSPEAAADGPLARVRDGDVVRLDADAGTLQVLGADLDGRDPTGRAPDDAAWAGTGRELSASVACTGVVIVPAPTTASGRAASRSPGTRPNWPLQVTEDLRLDVGGRPPVTISVFLLDVHELEWAYATANS